MNDIYYFDIYAAENFERVHYGRSLFLLKVLYRAVIFDALISFEQFERRLIVPEVERHLIVRIDFFLLFFGFLLPGSGRLFACGFYRFVSSRRGSFGFYISCPAIGRFTVASPDGIVVFGKIDYFVVGRRIVGVAHNFRFYRLFYIFVLIVAFVVCVFIRGIIRLFNRFFIIFRNINIALFDRLFVRVIVVVFEFASVRSGTVARLFVIADFTVRIYAARSFCEIVVFDAAFTVFFAVSAVIAFCGIAGVVYAVTSVRRIICVTVRLSAARFRIFISALRITSVSVSADGVTALITVILSILTVIRPTAERRAYNLFASSARFLRRIIACAFEFEIIVTERQSSAVGVYRRRLPVR